MTLRSEPDARKAVRADPLTEMQRPAPVGSPSLAAVVLSVGAPPELSGAVRSLGQQTIPVEIVVVNSGGGDVSSRLEDALGDVRVLSFDGHLGPGEARNAGLAATEAPFVAFLAADCTVGEDWAEKRMARHKGGAAAVGGSVASSNPANLFACASYAAAYFDRLPGLPDDMAQAADVSYRRRLFVEHGAFRNDPGIGVDAEFHQRLRERDRPVWAPEVRTTHRVPSAPWAAVRSLYREGWRSGRCSPQHHRGPLRVRVRSRLEALYACLRVGLESSERRLAFTALPLVALNAVAFEIGVERGRRRRDPVAVLEWIARRAADARQWKRSLRAWTKASRLQADQPAFHLGRAQALTGLGRWGEAAAAFDEALRLSPGWLAALEGLAQAAARMKAWDRSLEAWSSVHRLVPNHRSLYGLGKAMLELGRVAEAEGVFSTLRNKHPTVYGGHAGLARVAEERGEWAEAAELHGAIWDRFRRPEAIRRKVELLIALNRLDDARTVAASLEAEGVDPSIYVWASIIYLTAAFDWPAIVDLLQRHEELLLADIRLLSRYVGALSVLGRADQAIAVIDRSDAGSPAARLRLRLSALIWSGGDATAAFQSLWRGGSLSEVPHDLVAPLLTAACEAGGPDCADAILARVAAEAPDATREGDRIRTLYPFWRARVESLGDLFSPAPRLEPSDYRIEEQLPSRVHGLKRHAEFNIPLMSELCLSFGDLRRSHPKFHPDPNFVLADALEVALAIVGAIEQGHPFSLLRLGDGEGIFLPYRSAYQVFQSDDRDATQNLWWGRVMVDADHMAGLLRELQAAVHSADVVGLPDLHRICRVLEAGRLTVRDKHGRDARGVVAALDFAREPRSGSDALLTSCHVHQALAYWGLWDLILRRLASVSLITCHPQLAARLERKHGLSVEAVYHTPPARMYAAAFEATDSARHYPDVFERLRVDIAGSRRGQVVLVAAGLFGKIYCDWIKSAGGVAIDIGSAADYWCGYETRSLNENAHYVGPSGISERLSAALKTHPRFAPIVST